MQYSKRFLLFKLLLIKLTVYSVGRDVKLHLYTCAYYVININVYTYSYSYSYSYIESERMIGTTYTLLHGNREKLMYRIIPTVFCVLCTIQLSGYCQDNSSLSYVGNHCVSHFIILLNRTDRPTRADAARPISSCPANIRIVRHFAAYTYSRTSITLTLFQFSHIIHVLYQKYQSSSYTKLLRPGIVMFFCQLDLDVYIF